jgi:hypothetical protein
MGRLDPAWQLLTRVSRFTVNSNFAKDGHSRHERLALLVGRSRGSGIAIWVPDMGRKSWPYRGLTVSGPQRTSYNKRSEVATVNIRLAILLAALSSGLAAQAVVEAAAGATRAATTAIPADKAGKSIGSAFDKLGSALQNSGKAKPTSSSAAAPPTSATGNAAVKSVPAGPAPKPDVTFEDPSGIQEGMEYADVMKRFGPPSLLMSGPDQETLCYSQNDKNVDVTVRNGKVMSVQKAGGHDQPTAVTIK